MFKLVYKIGYATYKNVLLSWMALLFIYNKKKLYKNKQAIGIYLHF